MRNFADKQQNLLQVEENMSNLTSASNEASVSSSNRTDIYGGGGGGGFSPAQYHFPPPSQPPPAKKKRNQPGHPDPDAEVIALSPRALLATNRFVCEICGKGFQRDQNLQLHRRGHNLPWKLKQRASKDAARKKVYVCPEAGCVHHDPARALGDLTGIKKHFCRKHGEKKWKCDKCSKKYAVQSDWKAHSKTCGTKEYRCDCGTLFSRRDSFITHRAFCDALAEESARSIAHPKSTAAAAAAVNPSSNPQPIPSPFFNIVDPTHLHNPFLPSIKKEPQSFAGMIRPGPEFPPWVSSFHLPAILGSATGPSAASSNIFQDFSPQNSNPNAHPGAGAAAAAAGGLHLPPYPQPPSPPPPPQISATALLQKAEQMGAKRSGGDTPPCVFGGPARQFPWATHGGETMPATAGFGLNFSSRDGLVGGLVGSSFADKAAVAGAGGVGTHNSLFQNVIMDNPEVFHNHQGPSDFDEMAFMFSGRAFSRKDDGQDEESLDFQAAMDEFSRSGDGGGCSDMGKARVTNGMTRDFLGLRAWPQSDILTLTGLGSCMNSNGGGHNEP